MEYITNEEKAKIFTNHCHEIYMKLLMGPYHHAYETNSAAFRFANKENVGLFLFEIDGGIFDEPKSYLYIYYKKGARSKLDTFSFHNDKYFENYHTFNSDTLFLENLVVNHLEIKRTDLLFNYNMTSFQRMTEDEAAFKHTLTDFWRSNIHDLVKNLIIQEGSSFNTHTVKKASYYAKDAATYSYSQLDLAPLIKKVNDEDFEYQLNEAIAAYDNSLYMASCATLGVCIETVCKIILRENGKKLKDSDATMLDKLSERLKSEGLINYKDKSRIDVSYKVRNMASHTSSGKVIQNDCHFLINVIDQLVTNYID